MKLRDIFVVLILLSGIALMAISICVSIYFAWEFPDKTQRRIWLDHGWAFGPLLGGGMLLTVMGLWANKKYLN